MKKTFKRVFVATLAVLLAYGTSYAWIAVTEPQNSVTRSVQIAVDEASTGKLLIGATATTMGEEEMISANTATLKPCTSTDGKTFRDEDGNTVNKGYTDSYTVYLKSSDRNYGLTVSDIVISGDGAEDVINDALRIAVEYGGSVKIYDSTSTFGDVFGLSVSYRDAMPLKVTVWYEGTDEACTADNANASTGTVDVKVVLGLV